SRGGKKGGRRQLHFVADDDDLVRTIKGRDGFLQGDLTGFVKNDDIEQVRIERQRIRNAERAHQPYGLEVLEDSSRITRGEVANGFVAHRFTKLVLEFTPARGVGFLERLLVRGQLRHGQGGEVDVLQKFSSHRGANTTGVEGKPFAVALFELVHPARQNA